MSFHEQRCFCWSYSILYTWAESTVLELAAHWYEVNTFKPFWLLSGEWTYVLDLSISTEAEMYAAGEEKAQGRP